MPVGSAYIGSRIIPLTLVAAALFFMLLAVGIIPPVGELVTFLQVIRNLLLS